VFDQIAQNKRRSALLIAGFVVFAVVVGWLLSWLLGGLGWVGLVIGLVVAAVGAVTAWYSSDKIALRMARARPVDPDESIEAQRLHNLVEGLCIAAGLPMPKLYIVDDPAPNAFATGRNPEHAAIAVTTGLLQRMNRVELEGVLAHELGHVKNYDTLTATVAAVLVGGIVIAADIGSRALFFGGMRRRDNGNGNALALPFLLIGILGLILAPVAARLLQLALSRQRETLADFTAVSFTRYPPGLISALEKLKEDSTVVQARSRATAHLWIESPIDVDPSHTSTKLNRLFLTHPPLEERIAALREL
jgi:heat shock protein HtpX